MGKDEVKTALKTAKGIQFKTILLGVLVLFIAVVVGYRVVHKLRQQLALQNAEQSQQDQTVTDITNQDNQATASAQPAATPIPLPRKSSSNRTTPSTSSNSIGSMSKTQTYIVKPGDTTQKIAWKFYGHVNRYPEIERANHLSHNALLRIGQRLVIPALSMSRSGFSAQATASTNSYGSSISVPSKIAGTRYIVRRHDSLWKISTKAYQTGFKWPKIYRVNRRVIGNNPNLIYPKTQLVIPKR